MDLNLLLQDYKLVLSVIYILGLLIVRWLLCRQLARLQVEDDELPRRWSNSAKNVVNLLLLMGLILIWLSELRFIALSIATFAVALVIACKEVIQCLLGSFYQASTRSFNIGDWIKIGNQAGQVAESNWLTTTLLEIDLERLSYGYTGKTLTLPNSLLLGNTVHNLNFMRRYTHHGFTLTREPAAVDPRAVRAFLLERLEHYLEPCAEIAQRYNRMLEKRLEIKLPSIAPNVRRGTTELGMDTFSISFFCPTDQALDIEQQLSDDFFAWWNCACAELKTTPRTGVNSSLDPVTPML